MLSKSKFPQLFFSIFISLLIIVILFSFCVELRLFKRKRNLPRIDKLLSSVISIEKYQKTLLLFFIALTSFGCYNLKIDNYLSDEINEKSELFSQINYFDKTFGGIKPLSFKINDRLDYDRLQDFSKLLKSYNVNIDFTLYKGYTSVISSRMNDIGSLKSNIIYDQIIDYSKKDGFDTNISGIGYLFDKISNRLTIEVLIGLVIAILIIGLLFVVLNGFNLNYLLVALIPNLIPLFTCLGILSFSGFYFSLSNAFIFAIVFGLIVDDSIHIISAYSISRKNNLSIQQSISYCRKNTMQAVLKTTLVVIFTLIPLLFSEFRSISQLSYITILTACIALIFDIVFLPKILVRYIR